MVIIMDQNIGSMPVNKNVSHGPQLESSPPTANLTQVTKITHEVFKEVESLEGKIFKEFKVTSSCFEKKITGPAKKITAMKVEISHAKKSLNEMVVISDKTLNKTIEKINIVNLNPKLSNEQKIAEISPIRKEIVDLMFELHNIKNSLDLTENNLPVRLLLDKCKIVFLLSDKVLNEIDSLKISDNFDILHTGLNAAKLPNPLDKYLIIHRTTLSKGANGIAERVVMRDAKGKREVSVVLKTPNKMVVFSNTLANSIETKILSNPGPGVSEVKEIGYGAVQVTQNGEKVTVFDPKKMSNATLKELFKMFGRGGSITSDHLTKNELVDIRKKLFHSEHAGKQILSDAALQALAEIKHKGQEAAVDAYGMLGQLDIDQIDINDMDDFLLHELRISEQLFKGVENPSIHVTKTILGGSDPIEGIYTLQEFVPGVTLEKSIDQNGPLLLKEFLNYSAQLLDGLKFIHQRGIIHKDIKSDNVMLTQDGILKLIDFGEAISINGEQRLTGGVGSYIPERSFGFASSAPTHTVKTDIYTMGNVFTKMILTPEKYEELHKNFLDLSGSISTRVKEMNVQSIAEVDKQLQKPLRQAIDAALDADFSPQEKTELSNLLFEMLRFDPNKRASVEKLKSMVQNFGKSRSISPRLA